MTDAIEASPFHAGEQAMQTRAGVRAQIERAGRMMIRDFMPDQHREFFAMLPFLLVGSMDAQDRPWASIVTGRPGFLATPDARHLVVAARPLAGDPLADNLARGAPLGLLGIQLETRRRNRMNGVVTALGDGGFTVEVGQSFGNCPQYIQVRQPVAAQTVLPRAAEPEGAILSADAVALARRADTLFIATAAPGARDGDANRGVDVSHRGGKPGFVRVTRQDGASVLTLPDFRGNFIFNTFGNLALEPRAGLLFVDFDSGDLLSLTGSAEVIWDGAELAAFAGAQRLLRFRVAEGLRLPGALPWRWSAPQQAPQLAATGAWPAQRET